MYYLFSRPTVALPSKPDAPVAYELFEEDPASSLLAAFLNDLGLTPTNSLEADH